MKKLMLMLLLLIGTGIYAHAQDAKKTPAKLPKKLTEQLKLTADQQTKIDLILKTKAASMDSLNLNTDQANAKGLRKGKRMINTQAMVQINNVLTDDQKKIYSDFRDQQKEKATAKKAGDTPATPMQPAGN